jgi:hypothetical protein
MTDDTGHDTTDAEFVRTLKGEVDHLYKRLFHLNVGGRFHAFLEWCGVMGEHLNIVGDLVEQGANPFDMNRHTGETLPVAPYRLAYMAEKMECIFDGAIEVRPARPGEIDADLSERILAAVTSLVEQSTRTSHHHATRKALARDIARAVMKELADTPAIPYAPELAQKLRDTTARMAMPVASEAARQEHVTAVLEAARILGLREDTKDERENS